MFNFFKKTSRKVDASEVVIDEIKKLKKDLDIYKRYHCISKIAESLLCLKLLLNVLKRIDEEKWSAEYKELKNEFTN